MESAIQRPLLTPAACFTIACVAFSLLAATTIWRNQNAPQAHPVKQADPQRPRRVAVDTLYEESDTTLGAARDEDQSALSVLAQMIAACAGASAKLRDTSHDLVAAALLSELATVTAKLCQLQQCLCARVNGVAPHTGPGAMFTATISGLQAIVRLIEPVEGAAPPTTVSKRHDQAVQQLRAQTPALDYLIRTVTTMDLPPTPPNELAEPVLSRPIIKPSQISDMPQLATSPIPTGLTPATDTKGWIEPPPEYSPRTDGEWIPSEKQDEKRPIPDVPISGPEKEEGDETSENVLYQAVTADDVETVRVLLSDGADPNEVTADLQRSPLHQAAHFNHSQCLSLLLRNGAIMSTEDAMGDTALHLAAWAGNVEALASLLSHGADVDWLSGRDGYSPLWCAISASHIDAARLLLKHGARVSLRSGGGLTPLHQAAISGQSAMCELLLERGAQVNAFDEDVNTPLHYAATSGSVASVRALLRGGADVGPEQAQGLTPAHWAAHKGHTEVLKLLLDYGAPVDARAEEGATPLHLAANRGHLTTARLLLEKGADKTYHAIAWDGLDGTPAEMAKARGHNRLAKLIRSTS